jgi:hypothetical protein
VAGTDRDKACHELAAKIAKLAPAAMRLGREAPELGKNWNEELQQQRQRDFRRSLGRSNQKQDS